MSTVTTTRTANQPRVNLLPPEIAQQRTLARVKIGLGVGVLASLGVVAAAFVVLSGQVSHERGNLDAAQVQNTTLQAQAAQYANVPAVYAQVASAKAQLTSAMAGEVRWSFYLNNLSLSVPSRVWITQIQATEAVDQVGAAAAPGAAGSYLQTGLGSVTFQGVAFGHNDVAAWLESLARQKGYSQPYFTNSAEKDDLSGAAAGSIPVAFASQVTVTHDALSGRYTKAGG